MAEKRKKIVVEVSDTAGKVSGIVLEPSHPVAVLVLAHGAGAGMNHPFMETLSVELASRSIVTVRYNFPYMEKKQNRPDPAPVAEKTVALMLAKAHELYPGLPVFAAGKSFGGRMSSQRLSKETPKYVKGIVFYGFPLHPLGAPSIDRAAHLKDVPVPLLFLQGTKDKMAEPPLLKKVLSDLPGATLRAFEGADHSFKSGKLNLIPELAERTREFVEKVAG